MDGNGINVEPTTIFIVMEATGQAPKVNTGVLSTYFVQPPVLDISNKRSRKHGATTQKGRFHLKDEMEASFETQKNSHAKIIIPVTIYQGRRI